MRARGKEYFFMFLAHALKKTRKELLTQLDSYELSLWIGYFNEINRPPAPPKQSKDEIAQNLKSFFMAKSKVKK